MKLEGTLDIFSLRELIEMSVYSSVIGVLNIHTIQGVGHIFFRDGEMYHCTYQGLSGHHALARLFEQDEGSFAFVADASAQGVTLQGDIGRLLDECEDVAKRWRQVRELLPDTQVVPHFIRDPGVDQLRIALPHFAILAGIDGERALDEIASALGLELLDVCEAAICLCEDGLIGLRAATKRVEAAPAHRAGSQGVIDRILATLPLSTQPPVQEPAAQHYPASPIAGEEDPILRLLRS